MLIDLLIGYLIAFGIAWLLNKKYYKENPVSAVKALLMSFGIFFAATIFLTLGMHYRNSILEIPTKKIFDFSGIGMAILFYWSLEKVKKLKFEIITVDGGHVATFDSKEKADKYLYKNLDKNYSIKEK
jgi:hypothetical protein